MKVNPPKPRAPFHYDTNEASVQAGLACPPLPESKYKTRQSFKDECDINHLMAKFGHKYNAIPHEILNAKNGRYGDFSDAIDYRSALDAIIASEEQFDALPSHLRARFNHDPANLIDFMNNESNKNEAIELGLIAKPISSTANNEPAPAAEKSVTVTPE
jgi:phage internal scaffolding protein